MKTYECLKVLCCDTIIPPNSEVEMWSIDSHNRVKIVHDGCIHKVKWSSLRRVTKTLIPKVEQYQMLTDFQIGKLKYH